MSKKRSEILIVVSLVLVCMVASALMLLAPSQVFQGGLVYRGF